MRRDTLSLYPKQPRLIHIPTLCIAPIGCFIKMQRTREKKSKKTFQTLAGLQQEKEINAALSHEYTVWFLASPFLCTKSDYEKKISSLILLQFAINLVESFLLTSLVLKEARICFDFQPSVLRCTRFTNVSKGFQIQIRSDTNSERLAECISISFYK